MNRVSVGVLTTFVVILLGSGLLAYFLRDRAPAGATSMDVPSASATPSSIEERRESPLLWEIFGPDATGLLPSSHGSWEATAARIALRFSLAAFLAGLLAFRPRRGVSFSRRNPFVAQTQILMAVVAAAMMMVVGD